MRNTTKRCVHRAEFSSIPEHRQASQARERDQPNRHLFTLEAPPGREQRSVLPFRLGEWARGAWLRRQEVANFGE
jgi:hypothetical protein